MKLLSAPTTSQSSGGQGKVERPASAGIRKCSARLKLTQSTATHLVDRGHRLQIPARHLQIPARLSLNDTLPGVVRQPSVRNSPPSNPQARRVVRKRKRSLPRIVRRRIFQVAMAGVQCATIRARDPGRSPGQAVICTWTQESALARMVQRLVMLRVRSNHSSSILRQNQGLCGPADRYV